jgi:hypothetical protein
VSYDLDIWTVKDPSLSELLPQSRGWNNKGNSWIYQAAVWAVIVGRSSRALPEDLPLDVARSLPGASYLTHLHLSPISASTDAKKFLFSTAFIIAKRANGIILDQQLDVIVPTSGTPQIRTREPEENASLIALSWWIMGGPLAQGKRYDLLLDILEAELPEALPRRYGAFEPPEYLYAETGRNHFLDFLVEHISKIGFAWYPNPPISDVHLSIPETIGPSKMGFRSAHLQITVDADALNRNDWQTTLKRFWRRASLMLRPFYGDVRTFGGYRRSRERYWIGKGTEMHPVRSWWWGGLPLGPAHAIVLGEPYTPLWDSFTRAAERESDLAFAETEDWQAGDDVLQLVGPIPSELAQVRGDSAMPIPREYPAGWPFGPPRV